MARVLGVDLGSRRIGLALSDPSQTAATPLEVLERSGDATRDHQRILDAASEYDAHVVVVGLPLTLAGEVGTAARQVLSEVDELRRMAPAGLRIEVHDERLTTVTAERALLEGGVKRARRRQERDKVAAAVLLQAWLDGRASS